MPHSTLEILTALIRCYFHTNENIRGEFRLLEGSNVDCLAIAVPAETIIEVLFTGMRQYQATSVGERI